MNLKKGDRVKIVTKNDIEGEIVGFYVYTRAAIIRTATGNEWIVNPANLQKIEKK